jgi:hypothetical protein
VGYRCPDCGAIKPLFPGDAGDRLARDFEVPVLARIPFVPSERPEGLSALAEALLS